LELREGAVQLSTYALMHKINPYTIENNPVYINSFGVLYNAVILPFAFIFGNTLQLHRFLNAIFIIGQLTLMTIILRRQRTNWFVIAMVLLFMWIGQLFIAGPTARPDTLGELLFLSTLFIPVLNNFSKSSLIISGILGLLSFHTKIYFFLGPIIVSIYLFLFISKQKSLRYMLWVGGLLISSFLILNHFLETYFVNNIFPLFSYRFTSNYAHLIKQLIKFFRDYWSLLIISLGIFISISDKNQIPKLKIRTDIKHLKKPLFNIEFDFLLFCLVITSLMVFFLFGKHSGTYQTYFYHLITPFLTMSSLSLIDKYDRHKKGLIIIVVINLILHSYENLKPDFLNFDSPDWVKLNNYVMNSKEILNSPLDVSFLIEQEKPVAISGFTQYFFIYPKEPFFLMKEPQKLKDEASKYIKNIAGKIENKNYDFLETFQNEDYDLFLIGDKLNYPESDLNFISKYYHLVDFLYIPMPHSFEFWKMGIWKPISP